MRESNYSFPPQNRAVVSITQLVYDRRALDTSSILAILNNLTSLTYLTSTSPRIREVLTLDGGLERLLDILRQSTLPRYNHPPADLWGLNGPPTAKVIPNDRALQVRHSLAFQCVVNIGVRGNEPIRTRVVQAGALDIVAQILESWLRQRGISIFAGPMGSQIAAEYLAANQTSGRGYESHRRRSRSNTTRQAPSASTRPSVIAQLTSNFRPASEPNDTDVDMADGEQDTEDGASVGDTTMEVDEPSRSGPSTTPRARQGMLPLPISIPPRRSSRDTPSQNSSAGNSFSEDAAIPRTASVNSFPSGSSTTAEIPRARIPLLEDPTSNQSSPMGTPTRMDMRERRNTVVGRPITVNLAPRNDRRRDTTAGSGTSDGGEDMDLPTATMNAARIAAGTQALVTGGVITTGEDPVRPPQVAIVEDVPVVEEQDPAEAAAEQLRMDLLAGAPPGQPGAAETPRIAAVEAPTPRQAEGEPIPAEQAQIIIANGAPRGFHDLGSYVGINQLLNPDADCYSDDSILLALQLLAYLSKYPHVRLAFHHPRRPMHPTFNLGQEVPLPERPAYSETPNIFSLVERFTFRPSANDPHLFKIPVEIQYWAGVIMRNACRKDEGQGGTRQCASMSCGKWETFAREFAKCRRCRKAKYCSKTCQSRAWAEGHRFWCNMRTELEPGSSAHRPGAPPGGGPRPPHDDDDDDDNSNDGRGPGHRPHPGGTRSVPGRIHSNANTGQGTETRPHRTAMPEFRPDMIPRELEEHHRAHDRLRDQERTETRRNEQRSIYSQVNRPLENLEGTGPSGGEVTPIGHEASHNGLALGLTPETRRSSRTRTVSLNQEAISDMRARLDGLRAPRAEPTHSNVSSSGNPSGQASASSSRPAFTFGPRPIYPGPRNEYGPGGRVPSERRALRDDTFGGWMQSEAQDEFAWRITAATAGRR